MHRTLELTVPNSTSDVAVDAIRGTCGYLAVQQAIVRYSYSPTITPSGPSRNSVVTRCPCRR